MIWAPDPAAAVALAARTIDEVGTRPDLLPVRLGVHTGPALMRGCDWYGSAVNVAARLAGGAERNQALVSAATQSAAPGELARSLDGRREILRGVGRPISVWAGVSRWSVDAATLDDQVGPRCADSIVRAMALEVIDPIPV
jgi:adenylate cyclase